jgi:hypothetical protein
MDEPLDARTQALVDSCRNVWKEQKDLADDAKDRIGNLYLKYVLGLDETTIRDFITGKFSAYMVVGKKQGGVPYIEDNINRFWDSIYGIFPDTYSAEQIDILKKKGWLDAPINMLMTIAPPWEPGYSLLDRISCNAAEFP